MISLRKLIILGHLVGLLTLILGNPTAPPFEATKEFWECKDISNAQIRKFYECTSKYFSQEEKNATIAMYPDSYCIDCKHFCRKMDVVQHCIKDTSDVLRKFSNKSEEMVPFVKFFFDEGLQILCDNDGQSIKAFFNDDDGFCLSASMAPCHHVMEGGIDFDKIAVCDFTEPENDPFSKEFICQKLLDFLECVKVESVRRR